MPNCNSLYGIWKEGKDFKEKANSPVCTWVGQQYSYFFSALTKSFLHNEMLLYLKHVEVLFYYTSVHTQNGRNKTWAHLPATLNDSWSSEMQVDAGFHTEKISAVGSD